MPVLSSRSRAESKRHGIWSGRLLSQLLVGSHVVKRRLRALQVILSLLRIIFACPAEDLQGLLVRRHGRFEPGGARFSLAEAPERKAEVVLGLGPIERISLARSLFQGFLVRGYGRFEPGGARFSLAEPPERKAEVVLGRGPIEGHSLARSLFQGFLVRGHGRFEPGGARFPFAEAPERNAEVVLDRGPSDGHSLSRPSFHGFLVRREGFFKSLASSCLLAILFQRIRNQ